MFYPLFGAPYHYHDAPLWKADRHYVRWLAEGQAQAEEQEWQQQYAENEREKYSNY